MKTFGKNTNNAVVLKNVLIGLILHVLFGQFSFAQWTFLGPQWMSPKPVSAHSLALDHDWRPYEAFAGDSISVEVQRYENRTWQAVAAGSLPPGNFDEIVLRFDHLGTAFLALGPDLTMYKLDSVGWQWQAGLPPTLNAHQIQMKASPNGLIWIAWTAFGLADTSYIWNHSATNGWQPKGITAGKIIDLELDDDGNPIVLLEGKAQLQTLENGSWDSLPAFIHADGDYVNLATASDGTGLSIFVLHRDSIGRLNLEKYSNGNWQQIGQTGFALADETDLVLSRTGVVHVAAVQNSVGGLPAVWKWENNNWSLAGGTSAYNNPVAKPLLAFDSSNVFLSYLDEEKNYRNSVMVLGGPLASPQAQFIETISLFPNPAYDFLNIQIEKPRSNLTISLLNEFGQKVFTKALSDGSRWKIELPENTSGNYFVLLDDGKDFRRIGKVRIDR